MQPRVRVRVKVRVRVGVSVRVGVGVGVRVWVGVRVRLDVVQLIVEGGPTKACQRNLTLTLTLALALALTLTMTLSLTLALFAGGRPATRRACRGDIPNKEDNLTQSGLSARAARQAPTVTLTVTRLLELAPRPCDEM